jgi:radical SAM PhpK family P-methyltransferase
MNKTETYDCLIIGYNDLAFEEYEKILRSMGTHHSDYRDLQLNLIQYRGKPYRAADILSHFHFRDKKDTGQPPLTNHDVLWMCVTYLATYIHKHGFSFDYINLFHYEKDRLKEKLTHNIYLTVVICTTIYNFEHPILEVISFIKNHNRDTRIIVGGPYISKRSERISERDLKAFFKYMGADYYVCSREGERPLVQVLEALKNNGDFHAIDNIAFKEGDEFTVTQTSTELNPLEENMIDYSLFPPGDIGGFVNIRTSKGCPYSCSFCGFPLRSEKYKFTGVDYIKKELDALRDVGTVTHLHFTDDTFNVPKKRFRQVMEMVIREKYNFKWNCYFRCDHMDDDIVGLMKEAGCVGVFLGLESANETILKNMNKHAANKEFYRRAVPLFKKAGIATFMSIFIGFPGETIETFWETMEFLRETRADFHRPQLWYCDTLTPIWKQREKFGLSGNHFAWSHHTMDARTALDLQEESLLALDLPVWVPDPGYNYTGVYHMEQRGMTFDKQKIFLRFFGTIVKERLLFPDKKETSPQLLEGLRRAALFDEPGEPDMSPVETLSDTHFIAARSYWTRRFKEPLPLAEKNFDETRRDSAIQLIDNNLVEILKKNYDWDMPGILLAAFGVLLFHLEERPDTAVLTSAPPLRPFPVRMKPSHGITLERFIRNLKEETRQAAEHHLFALFILTHRLRKIEQENWSVTFDTAFQVIQPSTDPDRLQQCLAAYPPPGAGLKLVLNLFEDQDRFSFRFRYAPSLYNSQTLEKMCGQLSTLLKTAAHTPTVSLEDISLETHAVRRNPAVQAHEKKSFNF